MGGRGRSRTQRKHFGQSRENVWKNPDSAKAAPDDVNNNRINQHWQPFATQNPAFDEYYKEQEIVSPEEWDTFMEYLRKPLPAAFRINSSSQFYVDIRSQLENDFAKFLKAEDSNGCEVEAIKPLPWYPDNLAWQSHFSRMELRKNQNLKRFHEFLKLENEIGNITRQEAVSMVPPLFLDVRPDHFVLDMCAAPGSKTFQLLEMIHKLTEPGNLPSGMVMANDLDVQRCNLLIHQTKRMCTANLVVTNHEAQHFPSCHLRRNHFSDSNINCLKESSTSQLQFDRVLCDVPCSGDGTLRKAPDIWKKWIPGSGNGLHGLQIQIAMRGLALLKVGGRMVYSTCSMNPVENEAVVAEVLRRCGGSVELVDVSTEHPQLVRRPGLKKWKVRDKAQWLASHKDAIKSFSFGATPSMFPSGKSVRETTELVCEADTGPICNSNGNYNNGESINSSETEVSDLPLERCMRIVPHDQNSGAFFIAVFHKLSSLPAPSVPERKYAGPAMNKDTYSTQPQELMNGVIAVSNDEATGLSGEKDGQISPTTSDTNILVNGMNEISLDTDQNEIYEEDKKKDTEPTPEVKTEMKVVAEKRKLQIQGRWRGVDPVIFYRDDSVIDRIIEFYGIKESFPFKGHLISRNDDTDHVKKIYYISNSVKEVLELNLQGGQQLKIASVGLKMFERQSATEGKSAPCTFRITSEGLPLILPHMTKQILYASAEDFKNLLQYKSIKFPNFVDPEFGENASKLMKGYCVVILTKDGFVSLDSLKADAAPIAIGCWRGRTNISVMVTEIDCQELLSVLKLTDSENGGSEIKQENGATSSY